MYAKYTKGYLASGYEIPPIQLWKRFQNLEIKSLHYFIYKYVAVEWI